MIPIDDVLFGPRIGRSALLGIGLVLLLMTGGGVVLAFCLCRRRMSRMRGYPCLARLRGEDHTRD